MATMTYYVALASKQSEDNGDIVACKPKEAHSADHAIRVAGLLMLKGRRASGDSCFVSLQRIDARGGFGRHAIPQQPLRMAANAGVVRRDIIEPRRIDDCCPHGIGDMGAARSMTGFAADVLKSPLSFRA
jgi:hypothetical protein